MYDKSTRVLYMLQQLLQKNRIEKENIQNLFQIDSRTFERDIATLRTFLSQNIEYDQNLILEYEYQEKYYYLSNYDNSQLTSKEVLMLIKLLLGSRALCLEELDQMINSLKLQLSSDERKEIDSFIRNERHHFTPLKHGRKLLNHMWDFSQAIEENRAICMEYKKANNTIESYIVHPVGLVFTDYYFYAVSYVKNKDIPYPISFRLDRILSYEILNEQFKIPYSQRFEAGDFHNKINMMYQGELIKFTFRFTGHSVEAVLDKFPVSRVIEEGDGYCIIEAISYEQGLLMWLFSQGEWIKVLTPNDLVEKVKDKLNKMMSLY
ncbi:helix-turn-helix transcriptional regulator [Turicibacter sanguinis]|uniref:helix-turn-helix transcriptional regulator n=1 Tax=Turicibacter sanguinis TaxID=154288 RepID=UPI00189EA210|nr:WYL domain-containing protein [Turicibacter sanguinis]